MDGNTEKVNEPAQADWEACLVQIEPPPREFIDAVISGEIRIPRQYEKQMEERGWIPLRCEVWSRVMGYFRPIEHWNIGKKQEHSDRVHLGGVDIEKFTD